MVQRLGKCLQWVRHKAVRWGGKPGGRGVFAVLIAGFLLIGIWFVACVPPSFNTVLVSFRPSESVLLDRHGQPIQALRLDFETRRLGWTQLSAISPALQNALIVSEDRRFFSHGGVDWPAFWGSLASMASGGAIRGASTITMQLAGLLDPDLRPNKNGRRSIFQKIGQVRLALAIERSWTKGQILEAYLNLVSFRGEMQGVSAMAAGLFGKSPSALDLRASTVAAVLLRGPNAKSDRVAKRACHLIRRMVDKEDCVGLDAYSRILLSRQLAIPYEHQLAPHLARSLLKQPGQVLMTTLDADIQRVAVETLRRHLADLAERHVEDGALLVLDNRTGEVLAWVGSSGPLSTSAHVDGVTARRQAGSTLKPFLYARAIAGRWLTAASILDDSSLALDTGNGLYTPKNYDRRFRGQVTVRSALGSSLNVPAVSVLTMISVERFYQTLRDLGFKLNRSADFYGYSLALGSVDVDLLHLTNAYRTLANDGWFSQTVLFPNTVGKTGHRVFDPATAFILADILADHNARLYTFGFSSALDTAAWTAVKTGTSRDMRDNWCIGFSRRFTVGVWVGNFSGAPMHDVSGVTGAAPIWQSMMGYLTRRFTQDLGPPEPPDGLVARFVRFEPPLEALRQEWFLSGTEQSVFRAITQADGGTGAMQRIRYPVTGTLVAIDVDIPPDRQRIFFQASPSQRTAGLFWQLDGKALESVSAHQGWFPIPGRHRLDLVDGKGKRIDSVFFSVRSGGAKVMPP